MTLTACGLGDVLWSAADRQPPETSAAAEEPRESPATEEPREGDPQASAGSDEARSEPAEPGETTKAGTQLRLGEQAILPYRNGSVGITVTAVEKGDQAAFEREFGTRARGIVPYFIRYTVENLDGADKSFMSAPYLQPLTATGGPTGAVVTGGIDGCERKSAPKGFARAGATFDTCRLTGARTGAEIVGAEFDDDVYRDDPVVWRK